LDIPGAFPWLRAWPVAGAAPDMKPQLHRFKPGRKIITGTGISVYPMIYDFVWRNSATSRVDQNSRIEKLLCALLGRSFYLYSNHQTTKPI
jgi:hypothetical protein